MLYFALCLRAQKISVTLQQLGALETHMAGLFLQASFYSAYPQGMSAPKQAPSTTEIQRNISRTC